MSRVSPAAFAGARRAHVSFEVSNLASSIAFYRALLGVEPSKLRPGYAKFEPQDPALNLSLVDVGEHGNPSRFQGHFGIEVRSTDALEALAESLRSQGIPLRREHETSCCYAVQEKAWVSDPDGNPWEVFVVLDPEAPALSARGGTCCAPAEVRGAPQACCGPARDA